MEPAPRDIQHGHNPGRLQYERVLCPCTGSAGRGRSTDSVSSAVWDVPCRGEALLAPCSEDGLLGCLIDRSRMTTLW